MFIYALLGRQFFANRFYFDVATGRAVPIGAPGYFDPHLTERPRSNFDSFIHSIATIFQVLTGEDWQFIMYDAMRCAALDGKFFEGAAAFYFVSLVFLGNYIMLNLFLAIILGNFGTEKKSADDVRKLITLVQPDHVIGRSTSSKIHPDPIRRVCGSACVISLALCY